MMFYGILYSRSRACFVCVCVYTHIYDMIYLITAIGLTSGGSSTVHIYT